MTRAHTRVRGGCSLETQSPQRNRYSVEAGTAFSLSLRPAQALRIINVHGGQVVDLWGFALDDPAEFLSMEHTRLHLNRVTPQIGDTLVTNRRRAALTIVEDTSGCIHDTLLPACDRHRYELLGHVGYHKNCRENLLSTLTSLGLSPAMTPSPLNLFENAPVGMDGSIFIYPPVAKAGSFVELRAELSLIVIGSVCPQDLVPTNGIDLLPKDIHLEVVRSPSDKAAAATPQ